MNNIDDSGNRLSYGEGLAIREPSKGKGRYDLITPFGIRRVALWYELGVEKYPERNWEKGMPFSRYMNSAKRHLDKYIMGMEDEDHLAAAVWNILSIMHHQELNQTELDDMPHYLKEVQVRVKQNKCQYHKKYKHEWQYCLQCVYGNEDDGAISCLANGNENFEKKQ